MLRGVYIIRVTTYLLRIPCPTLWPIALQAINISTKFDLILCAGAIIMVEASGRVQGVVGLLHVCKQDSLVF